MYRILVVEDDEVIAKTIRQHLQSWNYEVFAVADFNSVMEGFRFTMDFTGARRFGKYQSCRLYLSLR